MRALLILTALAAAAYAEDPGGCGNATLKGSYGYLFSGTVPAGPGAVQLVQGVGVRRFDGQGNFVQIDTRKAAITGSVIDSPGSGTYKVNADCTGVMVLSVEGVPGSAELRFVVVNNGKEFYWLLLTPPPAMITGHAVRQ